MILDACYLIDLLAGDAAARARLEEVVDEQLVVPTLAYTEVAVGLNAGSRKEQTFDEVMEQVTLVPYDGRAARRAVDLQRQLRNQGEPIGAVDAMMAGIAIARDDTILTRNVEEFARTPARVSPY